MAAEDIIKLYRLLYERYGPQGWWPAEMPFEVVVGAILTQATSWKNAERAIENLKSADLISPESILQVNYKELARLIRPAGYFNSKAKRLKAFVEHLFQRHGGSLERMFSQDVESLREELLTIHGIGLETADSIALYAANKPTFVVDSYTRRLLSRLGLIEKNRRISYSELRRLFMENLPQDVLLYKEYHALIVKHCKEICRKKPLCERCDIEDLCAYEYYDDL